MSEYIVDGAEPNSTVLKSTTPNGYEHEKWLPVREVIVRCRDCKHWRRFYPESEQRFGTCRTWRYTTRFDGYCHNASKVDGERQSE